MLFQNHSSTAAAGDSSIGLSSVSGVSVQARLISCRASFSAFNAFFSPRGDASSSVAFPSMCLKSAFCLAFRLSIPLWWLFFLHSTPFSVHVAWRVHFPYFPLCVYNADSD